MEGGGGVSGVHSVGRMNTLSRSLPYFIPLSLSIFLLGVM